MVQIN